MPYDRASRARYPQPMNLPGYETSSGAGCYWMRPGWLRRPSDRGQMLAWSAYDLGEAARLRKAGDVNGARCRLEVASSIRRAMQVVS